MCLSLSLSLVFVLQDEGEILFRGRHVMLGYMKNPEKTQESIDKQGWLHSGDVGKLDSHGFLHITGCVCVDDVCFVVIVATYVKRRWNDFCVTVVASKSC